MSFPEDREEPVLVMPIGVVVSGREEVEDDYWGDVVSVIELDQNQFAPDVTLGLGEFSHLEVIFFMNRVSPEKIEMTARHPRNNPDWPVVGIFAQRPKARPNRLGLSRCRIQGVEGLRLTVEALDAVVGTPIIDIKPDMRESGPLGQVDQPRSATELMDRYYKTE